MTSVVDAVPTTFVFVEILNLLIIVPFEKEILKYFLLFRYIASTFATAPLAVGFVNESWYILSPTKFKGFPLIFSTIISSVTSHSASDGKIVWLKGLTISTCSPYKTWNKIFKEVSVPFEL